MPVLPLPLPLVMLMARQQLLRGASLHAWVQGVAGRKPPSDTHPGHCGPAWSTAWQGGKEQLKSSWFESVDAGPHLNLKDFLHSLPSYARHQQQQPRRLLKRSDAGMGLKRGRQAEEGNEPDLPEFHYGRRFMVSCGSEQKSASSGRDSDEEWKKAREKSM